MLEMRHVTKIFNPGTVDEKIALNDLSFTLNDGDFVTYLHEVLSRTQVL